MALSDESPRDLVFGLLALQNGMIQQEALLAAFRAWLTTRDRPMAGILVEQGALTEARRGLIEALAAEHLALHGGDAGLSLAALNAGKSTLEALETLGGAEFQATLAQVGSGATIDYGSQDRTATYSVGTASSEGQRFRVLRPHARGGLGAVFVAMDGELNREVALKQILDRHADDPGSRSRFLLEAEITGGLEHPGIVPVYGLGTYDDGRPFYAMRFVRGDSLKDAIAAYHEVDASGRDPGARSLGLRKLLRRFTDVCNAIDYAHGRGVLHRDIKPGNIIVGKHGETLVVDWGLAKPMGVAEGDPPTEERTLVPASASGADETLPGSALGTPAYMSPEQAAGDHARLGVRSDVYSLGATLYSLLTGKPPFDRGEPHRILARVQGGDFPPPRKLDPSIDPPLEAICLKAMALRPEGRYASCRALAEDVERWMADEPVTAWREPLARRLNRWARRHRVLVASSAAASMVALAALGHAFYDARLRANQRLTAAMGRVEALTTAEIREVLPIVEQLAPDRDLVRGRLAALAVGEGPGARDRRRLPAALALLRDDPGQAPFLARRAREARSTPREVLVIARELAGRNGAGADLVAELRRDLAEVPASMTDGQLRAAGLLAWLAPVDASWDRLGPPLARKLAAENTLLIADWAELFRPAARPLVAPLRVVYADRANPEARDRAFTLILDFVARPDNPTRAADLAALLAEADPEAQGRISDRLTNRTDRDRVADELAALRADPRPFDESGSARQARIAGALARFGRYEAAWATLARRDDPAARTELIHELPRSGADPSTVAARLIVEPDPWARRALLLCLGEFPPDALPGPGREALAARLEGWYRTDPDPGVHGAVDWLLRRRWGRAAALDAIDRELASPAIPPDRGWFVNGQRQTFAVVRGPVEFAMGSTPEADPDRVPAEEAYHRRRIPRSFAIATREVTVTEYAPFLDAKFEGVADRRDDPQYGQYLPRPDCATGLVNWYEAVRYCNWLSDREGIPRDQWCYPEAVNPEMTLDPARLARLGYRLPTEAEWEYACRAGTTSSRYYGRSDARLSAYAWHGGTEKGGVSPLGRLMSPVGLLKPNDLGLFDPLGNAMEWCDGPFLTYPSPAPDRPAPDDLPAGPDRPGPSRRVLRGGTFFFPAPLVRSAHRVAEEPATSALVLGLRVARTLP